MPTLGREKTKDVISNVHLETGEDPEGLAAYLLGHGQILLNEVGQEALAVLPMGTEVVVGDPDDLKTDLVATP